VPHGNVFTEQIESERHCEKDSVCTDTALIIVIIVIISIVVVSVINIT
jgi:hypothetical protein